MDKQAIKDRYNQNKKFTKLSCYIDKVFDKTDWVSEFIKEKVHKLTKTRQRIENNSH